jgi:hypothetical protein
MQRLQEMTILSLRVDHLDSHRISRQISLLQHRHQANDTKQATTTTHTYTYTTHADTVEGERSNG